MAKQNISINFSSGLDQKTDPLQLPIGRFVSLENSIFTIGGRLTKRNGYGTFTSLPLGASFLTTFNGNLTAIGSQIQAYSSSTNTWLDKGKLEPVELSVLPLIRSNTNQGSVDTAIANGLVCTVYTDQTPSSLSTPRHMYAVANVTTGQNIVEPTVITGANGSPRAFVLGSYFIIGYSNSSNELQYISISNRNPSIVNAAVNIGTVASSAGLSWDAIMAGNNLYFAYNTTAGGQQIKVQYLQPNLVLSSSVDYTNSGLVTATIMTMSVDASNPSNPIIWVAYYDSGSSTGYAFAVGTNLNKIITNPVEIIASGSIQNLASIANAGVMTFYSEVENNYGYDSGIPTHYINVNTLTQSGTLGTASVLKRSVGLASKAVAVNGITYFLASYQSPFQPTYFLLDGSGNIISRFAYSNGGGYCTVGLPSITVADNILQVGYRYKDFLEGANASQAISVTKTGIYTQTGLNLITFILGTSNIVPVEIAQTLSVTGGFEWEYDGYVAVENNFFVWPDSIEATWSDTGGDMVANPPGWVSGQPSYEYQVVYTYTNNQGNIEYSAPSIPVEVILDSDMSTAGSVTIDVPTVRLTYKTANPIKISIYRWSIANQIFYEVTSIATPLINDPTVDYLTFTDTLADASIIGNSIIYTEGGVVEDVGAPAFTSQCLFDDRVWGIDAEDPNLLWYSKQVIEATPVEFSDLFTFYVAPSTASQGSTGNMFCLAPMDDKLIIFKKDAMYYVNGTGPDNTGANSSYSQPIFITATVGSIIQQSIVFTDAGLMFQSDKGIWLLERNGITVVFIGAPVRGFTDVSVCNSAVSIPGTTQVRFTMNSGVTLMYDYFFQQWGSFIGVPAISSTLYNGLHTYLDSFENIYQETPGVYLDGNNPVLLQFTTGWLNLAGVLGYQRFYEAQLLASYVSPHKLYCTIAYDHGALSQQSEVLPDNFTGNYGSDSLYGQTSPYGGPGSLESYRIQAEYGKCDSFQISIQEVYDASFGVTAGAGFTLSTMNLVVDIKRGFRPFPAAKSVG